MEQLSRKPTKEERKIIEDLIQKSDVSFSEDYLNKILVCSMSDGGMGSLRIYPNGKANNYTFGREISSIQFRDQDDVDVIVSLYIDTSGDLFELDVWKTDYSPLIQFPALR